MNRLETLPREIPRVQGNPGAGHADHALGTQNQRNRLHRFNNQAHTLTRPVPNENGKRRTIPVAFGKRDD